MSLALAHTAMSGENWVQKYNDVPADYPTAINTHAHKHAHKQTKSSLSKAGRWPPRWSGWRGMKETEARTADVRPPFSQRLGSEWGNDGGVEAEGED